MAGQTPTAQLTLTSASPARAIHRAQSTAPMDQTNTHAIVLMAIRVSIVIN